MARNYLLDQLNLEIRSAAFHHERATAMVGDKITYEQHHLMTYWGGRYHDAIAKWEAYTGARHSSRTTYNQ